MENENRTGEQKTAEKIHPDIPIPTELHARTISKAFKFIAAVGIIVCGILKWAGFLPGATMAEICIMWATVYGVGAGTIDMNIMFEKFTGGKK